MLALVVPHGHLGGAVRQHVCGHQHRVEEEPGGDQLALLLGLLLELVHAVEISPGGHRAEQPAQLGVLLDVGLAEEDAALRVEAGRDQDRGGVVEALAKLGRVIRDRGRVKVDDAVDALAPVLALHVLADRADVVAQVLAARRLNPAEDPFHGGRGL